MPAVHPQRRGPRVKVTLYGTRGSVPVAGPQASRYGGNTTCLRVDSACLPADTWLIVDAGTGIVPLSWAFASAGARAATLLFTHYHHDHTQGLPLTHFPYVQALPLALFGPLEDGVGPHEALTQIMCPPLFPVDYTGLSAHIRSHAIESPDERAIVIHSDGGVQLMSLAHLDGNGPVAFESGAVSLDDCLIVRMRKTHHPQVTFSYRFEERPSGRVFVFVTDHENEPDIPAGLRAHLADADLLVMDCQYTRDKYDGFAAGFGHATPDYVAGVAREVRPTRLGITHHDPPATDDQIDAMVDMVRHLAPGIEVFGCRDGQEVWLDGDARV